MKTRIVLIGLFPGLLFGIATPFSKIILEELNSFQLAGLLYLGAALAFFSFILKNRNTEFAALRQSGKEKYLAGVIVFGGIIGPFFLMAGLKAFNAMS